MAFHGHKTKAEEGKARAEFVAKAKRFKKLPRPVPFGIKGNPDKSGNFSYKGVHNLNKARIYKIGEVQRGTEKYNRVVDFNKQTGKAEVYDYPKR